MATKQDLQEVLGDFLTAREAAKEIGVHVRTLKHWKSAGFGPDHFYIGKRLFYRRSDVIKWLNKMAATKEPVISGRRVRA